MWSEWKGNIRMFHNQHEELKCFLLMIYEEKQKSIPHTSRTFAEEDRSYKIVTTLIRKKAKPKQQITVANVTVSNNSSGMKHYLEMN